MEWVETKGTIRQGSRVIAEGVEVRMQESGAVWRGIFPDLPRERLAGADLNFFFTLALADGRTGDVSVSFRQSRLIPFEIAFEGVRRKN